MMAKRTVVVATTLLAFASIAGMVIAQENKPKVDVQTGKGGVSVDVQGRNNNANNNANANANQNQNNNQNNSTVTHRASEIERMKVRNEAGKELATVKDIVIDTRTGDIRYAAVSYGGFLGLGDKLFAIPWYAFQRRHDASSGKDSLVLNIDEQTLKNAPGFDKSQWPNFGDTKFTEESEKHYGKYRDNTANRAGVDVKAGSVSVEVNANKDQNSTQASRDASKDLVLRAHEIIGMTVRNQSNKDLGSVNDLMVDMGAGKVRYAALSYGGFLGVGNKLFAVPWSAFRCDRYPNSNKHFLELSINEDTLKNAPGFDKDKWPNFADPQFGQGIDTYYGSQNRK